jgi:hypothetical protein
MKTLSFNLPFLWRHFAMITIFCLLCTSCNQPTQAEPLWKTEFSNGQPEGWTISPGDWKNKPYLKFSLEKEGNVVFARFHADKPDSLWADYNLVLPERVPAQLRIKTRLRTNNFLRSTDQDWFSAQIDALFVDKNDKYIQHIGTQLRLQRNFTDWTEREQIIDVPKNAAVLQLKTGLWGAGGDFDIAEIQVFAVNAEAKATPVTTVVATKSKPRTLYVSPKGNDASDGSLAKPLKSINAAAQRAQAGDTVAVRAGTYRETVIPTNSGTEDASIIYRPYQNEKVVISGTEIISNWTKNGATWTAPMATDFFRSLMNQSDQIFVDGRMIYGARFPNMASNTGAELIRPAKSTITRFISKTRDEKTNWTTAVFEDTNLPDKPDGFYEGAEIVMQPNKDAWSWTLSGTIVEHKGKSLTLRSRNDGGKDGDGKLYPVGSRYYLHNKRELLDAEGEWVHDTNAGQLLVRMKDDPKTHVVEAKKRDFAFNLDGKSYVTVQGFELFGCSITTDVASGGNALGYDENGNAVYPWRGKGTLAESNHILLDGLKASYLNHFTDMSGHFFLQWGQNTGLVLSGSDSEVRNCEIRKSAGNGIVMLGRRHKIINNLIEDVSYNQVDNAAIATGNAADSFDHEIGYNTIRRTGRSGILPRNMANSDAHRLRARIHHNDISQCMLQDYDGGGIYLAVGDAKFLRMDHNLIHDMEGFTVSGIYPDYAKNYIFDHNVIWNVEWGIHIQGQHEGVNNTLCYNNTILVKNTSGVTYGPFGFANSNGQNAGTLIQNNLIGILNPKESPGYKPISGNFEAAEKSNNHEWDGVPNTPSDPRFTSLNTFDLTLAANSPAKDAGKPMTAVTHDGISIPAFNDSVTGTAPDIGAYEVGTPRWKAGYRPAAQ